LHAKLYYMYCDYLQKHLLSSALHSSDTDGKVTRDPRAYCVKETKNIYERPDTDKSELEIHCEAPHWRIYGHKFNNNS